MAEYPLGLWDKAVELYEKSDNVGIPLHARPVVIRDAWRETARKELARSALSELSAQVVQ